MRALLVFLLSSILAGAALTSAQLQQHSQWCESRMPLINYTSPQIFQAAQNVQTWIDANRGSLPARFTNSDLTTQQRNQVSAVIGDVFSAEQKVVLFNGVALLFNDLTPPPPTPDEELATVKAAIRQQILVLFGPAIDAARPGLTDNQKIRAVRIFLEER